MGIEVYSSLSFIRLYVRVGNTVRSSVYLDSLMSDFQKDSSSNSVLLQLNKGDDIYLDYYSHSYDHYSDKHYQTALSGFLYEPFHGFNIAWSVTYSSTTTFTGSIAAFPFNSVWLNNGGVWDNGSYAATILVSGIYWLKLAGMSPQLTSSQFDMILSVNSQSIINVMEKITNGGRNVRSHSIAFD